MQLKLIFLCMDRLLRRNEMLGDKKYNQYEKRKVRHISVSEAIDMLTSRRNESCCVSRDYVRKIYDYYTLTLDDSNNSLETGRIESYYIREWEKLHDSCIGVKRAEDLCVCYLCGPEPQNDFDEFVSKGVLPQNIWAFELDNGAYNKAIQSYEIDAFPQPRIIKQNIESFIKNTPKKFDIIYIDACGSVPSSQHALRCVTNICSNQRLASPGIIISNFTEPDEDQVEDYLDLVTLYLYCKHKTVSDIKDLEEEEYELYKHNVYNSFSEYYGDFLSAVLRDIPAVLVPLQRLNNNTYLERLFRITESDEKSLDEYLTESKGHSIANFFMVVEVLNSKGMLDSKTEDFYKEIGDVKSLVNGIKKIIDINSCENFDKEEMNDIRGLFDNNSIYQFLDRAHFNMVYDIVINQLTYPYHYVLHCNRRYLYKAKYKRMYMDITVYDECRYIYEWLPAIDQLYAAFNNLSWQYIFRFALDGLVKQRAGYNNEFFYQGAVVSGSINDFSKKKLPKRLIIKE